jgi:hypothetical protein
MVVKVRKRSPLIPDIFFFTDLKIYEYVQNSEAALVLPDQRIHPFYNFGENPEMEFVSVVLQVNNKMNKMIGGVPKISH